MPTRSPDPDLITDAVAAILQTQDFERFHRWLTAHAVEYFPHLSWSDVDESDRRSLVTHLALELWNATPLPRNRYQPDPLPDPERNKPCPCGSGVKYKRCCRLPAVPPLQLAPEVMWVAVVEALPERELAAVGASGAVSPEFLSELAEMALEVGTPRRAARLLEPAFEDPQRLGEAYRPAFEALLDAYEELDWIVKRSELIVAVAEKAPPALSSGAWQMIATIAADAESWEEAWDAFAEARERAPTHPSIGLLEIMLLGSEGRYGEASDRARFVLAQHRRGRMTLGEETPSFLERVVAHPETAFIAELSSPGTDHVERYNAAALAALERPVPTYSLNRDAGLPALTAPPSLAEVEETWAEAWKLPALVNPLSPAETVWDPAAAARWLQHLDDRPESFDSFEILEDLVFAGDVLAASTGDKATLVLPLTGRAEAILDALLPASEGLPSPEAANEAEGEVPGLLPWIVPENRPALRLLLRRAGAFDQVGDLEGCRRVLERLLNLNPLDQGARGKLVTLRLRAGDDEGALDLSDRQYQDTSLEQIWGQVLALVRLDRLGEALSTLAEAHRRNPHVADELCRAASGRRPDPPGNLIGFTGGKMVAARHYVAQAGDVWWSSPDALAWLHSVRRGLKP